MKEQVADLQREFLRVTSKQLNRKGDIQGRTKQVHTNLQRQLSTRNEQVTSLERELTASNEQATKLQRRHIAMK